MKTRPVKLFVYGTLRKKYGPHYLMESATYIGLAKTFETHFLTDRVGLPALIDTKEGYHIGGELFEIDHQTLTRLDAYENCPHLYYRRKIPVVVGETKYKAWAYFLSLSRIFGPSLKEFGGQR